MADSTEFSCNRPNAGVELLSIAQRSPHFVILYKSIDKIYNQTKKHDLSPEIDVIQTM